MPMFGLFIRESIAVKNSRRPAASFGCRVSPVTGVVATVWGTPPTDSMRESEWSKLL